MVDFAGFHIYVETLEPLPKYMDAICDFPTPTSTTDIRSWFGLVNQVVNYALLCDNMAPFKQYFSAQCADLNGHHNLIESSKPLKSLSSQRSAMMSKSSTLRNEPAYAQSGLVTTCLPDCCTDGWRVTR